MYALNKKPFIDKAKISTQSSNSMLANLVAYGANTHCGIVRTYNEDRISIVLDLKNPKHNYSNLEKRIQFFAVFDGHGGEGCS